MPLSYNNNTPQAGQTVASTQAPILTNFQSIDTALNGPTGGGSGGGNFTTYAVQNTTASFAAKPVNPIGVLHTIASSAGNPELAWINNVDSTGAGPFNGTQLTGGGVTAAYWCQFNGALGLTITPAAGFNIPPGACISHPSAGDYTITFLRHFANTNYVVQILPSINSTGTSVQVGARNVASLNFLVRNASGLVDSNDINVVIFGTLV